MPSRSSSARRGRQRVHQPTGIKSSTAGSTARASDLFRANDALPHGDIIDLVSSDDDSQEVAERPVKRARTGPPENYIPIARKKLSFSRQCSNGESFPRPMSRMLSNDSFRLCYRKEEGLRIKNQGRKLKRACTQINFSPGEVGDLTDAEMLILSIAEKSTSLSPSAGRIWTAVYLNICTNKLSDTVTLAIDFELRWMTAFRVSSDLHTISEQSLRSLVISTFFPDAQSKSPHQAGALDKKKWTPQQFYEAAHVTDKNDAEPDDLYVPGLTANLFPYQRRAVKWLLRREGVRWAPQEAAGLSPTRTEGKQPSLVIPCQVPEIADVPSHFLSSKDADGNLFYISELFGVSTRNPGQYEAFENSLRGGILSEEMGLGKTVEMISLILLHPRNTSPVDPPLGDVFTTGATLIVTPPSLKNQWMSELRQHAPNLRVMAYAGKTRSCSSAEEETKTVEQFASHDVVVTTYNDLRSEIYIAEKPPDRDLRNLANDVQRYRPRSPLVQVSWWRVCLDEAQEIESGVSNTATVARWVPRINAWGVTGTPVKDSVEDLWGLLLFLHYEPFASHPSVWRQLVQHHKREFRNLFGRIALRHSKRTVGDELVIPAQKRFVISMPFTAIEEQHYQSLFKRLANDCGLDTAGAPLADFWDPNDPVVLESMRSALSRLRQTALHPEIGAYNNRVGHKARPMRTVEEVLNTMIDQSESVLLTSRRALLSHRLKQGQLLENSPQVKKAIEIWQTVLKESKALVTEARDKLEQAQKEVAEENPATSKFKDGGRRQTDNGDFEDDRSSADEDGHDKPVTGRVGEAQRDLRYALEILHKAEFFCANGMYQVKTNEEWTKPDSEEFRQLEKLETEAYERAKVVRREILLETRSRAMQLMADLAGKAGKQGFVEIPEAEFAKPEGIEGRRIGEELDRLAEILSAQAAQMDEWREAVIQLLLKDLVDDDEDSMSGKVVEITGDEYEDSTKVQDEIQAYIIILKAAISDRNMLLTGQVPSGLALYEERQALRMAKQNDGPAPQLMLRLFAERRSTLPKSRSGSSDAVRSLRAVIIDLRDIASRLRSQHITGASLNNITSQRAQAELECVTRQLSSAQSEQTRQLKVSVALEKEAKKIGNAMNTRIAYYRQLQAVSDMVALYEGPKDDATIAALEREESELIQGLAKTESKYRYLLHLRDTESKAEESRICVICQSTFSIGVLTVCGHQFCKECITLWFRAHHNCPVCKRKLTLDNLHDITLKTQSLKVIDELGGGSQQGQQGQLGQRRKGDAPQQQAQLAESKKTGIYTAFSTEKLEEIKNIELPGPSFTTKVDTIVRHLMWLRRTDAGAKSIVFSQYPAFLTILAEAFSRYRIAYSRYADRNGIEKFKNDPSIECFLLHARAHSSGLNLVNASHVLLCEPLLNTALELQAIARVHRIGQKQETTVWLYIVDGTVEESIYNLSVRRRMAHIGQQDRSMANHDTDGIDKGNEGDEKAAKGKSRSDAAVPEEMPSAESSALEPLLDSSLELANSMELQQAQLSKLMGKGKMTGEEVDKSDLWTCLFGNASNSDAKEERLHNDVVIRRHLTAAAAQERQQTAAGPSMAQTGQ